ncbi:uncharacterized protein PRCAT00003798001 [Priceomyces carsonii]|uniref:uncharacterized protein n=1 Tax=Priceomyces carsonii TaxID=28549 RepID=UPI002EDB5971|nr:unnamed protein product [Priceomyces carsonii]
MYRNILRTPLAQRSVFRASNRAFSRSSIKASPVSFHTKAYFGLGLATLAFGYKVVADNRISNESDEVKINEDLEKSQQNEAPIDDIVVVIESEEQLPSETVEEEVVGETGKAEGVEGDEEAEDSHQSAYNPETGEINWDCPCLGGMAHGPCGEEFKEAFSCFIYSESEPRGIECIKKFQNMRDCFKQHPEHYAEELRGDDDDDDVVVAEVDEITISDNGDDSTEPAEKASDSAKL